MKANRRGGDSAAHALRRRTRIRLGIRGKLNMLLLLPLAAVLLVAVPFVVGQIDNARSAGQTALTAHHAREIGGLISVLQQERLLTAAYVASPTTNDSAMVRQQRTVDDTAGGMRAALAHGGEVSDELSAALVRIGSLREIRENALRRGVSLDSVARTYHAVIGALIDALRMVPQRTSDAEGTRQLTALEALLRANEQNSLYGMALIVAAVSPETGTVLLDDSAAQADLSTERFVQQADVEHSALVVTVAQGDEARRVAELAKQLPDARAPNATTAFVADALAAAESQSALRRLVQDRVTGQINDAAAGRADGARNVAWTVGLGAAGLFMLVALLTVVVSRSIANPLRRLTTAATKVADLAQAELVRVTDTEVAEEQVPRLSAIDLSSKDELGDLAAAFNRVQATAAMLVERQAITRRNVSLIFANVAQRTQNLVGRQATLVDELERNEQNTELLERLYRLDHISTRLRRNAENLLVVAGSRDENKIAGPIELATALRSALAEIEDYQRVRLGTVDDVLLASQLGPDLILMFAELLENAASFSPPDSFVDVRTTFGPDGSCVVSIVDHGIGMAPERLTEENHRLVQRERLDVAPTSVLGLFVVGRLARRHSLAVELVATPGGGVTARMAIPPTLFRHKAVPVKQPEPAAAPSSPAAVPTQARLLKYGSPIPELAIPPAGRAEGFCWFPATTSSTQAPAPAVTTGAERVGISRGGLRRRVAGAQLPGSASMSKPDARPPGAIPAAGPRHDAEAVRTAMDGYQSAITKAAATLPDRTGVRVPPSPPAVPRPIVAAGAAPGSAPGSAPAERRGLTRRVPGANLAPGLRNQRIPQVSRAPVRAVPSDPAAWTTISRRTRDPDAERAAFDSFAMGLARADRPPDTVTPHDPTASRGTDSTKGSTT